MLTIQNIRDNMETITEKFSNEMMEQAKLGNINYFRDTLDQLTEEEYYDLYFDTENYFGKNKNSILEIISTLVFLAIKNFDEVLLRYVCEENTVFLRNKYQFIFLFDEMISLCVTNGKTEFAKIILDLLKNETHNLRFEDFYTDFIEAITKEKLNEMQFYLNNFNVPTAYILSFLCNAIQLRKLHSLKFLLREYRSRDDVSNSKDNLINFFVQFNEKENDEEFKTFAISTIEEMWDTIINSLEVF